MEEYKQLLLKEEEQRKALMQVYEVKEEKGLDRFDSALSQHSSFDLAKSKELGNLLKRIEETNESLSLNFKREHKYVLKPHEEHLYKDVVYDSREGKVNPEHTKNQKSPYLKNRVGRPRNHDENN